MTKKRKKSSPTVIVQMFVDKYKDIHDSDYLVNYPIFNRANSLSNFYTVTQVQKALDFYFKARNNHNFYEFTNTIDKWLTASEQEDEKKKELEALIKTTKKRVSKFEE